MVEVEADGTATPALRRQHQRPESPDTGTAFTASYRIGNGTAGNVGAESLTYLAAADRAHPVLPQSAARHRRHRSGNQRPDSPPRAAGLSHPGARRHHGRLCRVAELNPQVDQRRRIAALDRKLVHRLRRGRTARRRQSHARSAARPSSTDLERYRLAGQDLELDSPQYVSLEIALTVCVDPELLPERRRSRRCCRSWATGSLPNGQKGLFYPDNFTFGQTVYLSPIYAAARSVAGVRVGARDHLPAARRTHQPVPRRREIPIGGPCRSPGWTTIRNFPDHGQLTLVMEGGK